MTDDSAAESDGTFVESGSDGITQGSRRIRFDERSPSASIFQASLFGDSESVETVEKPAVQPDKASESRVRGEGLLAIFAELTSEELQNVDDV